jgi:heme-degrading monooxygenase HmoA
MIDRVWRGWTTADDADAYEELLTGGILPEIAETVGEGYRGHRVLRRETDSEIAFVTILRFESMADVQALTGSEPTDAHVPEDARELLSRWEESVEHFEVVSEVSDGLS